MTSLSAEAAIRTRRHLAVGPDDVSVLLAGLGVAVMVRGLVAGRHGASSLLAALVFSSALATLIVARGWRPARFRWTAVFAGLAGGALLVAGPAATHGTAQLTSGVGAGRVGVWVVVVSLVAITEEVFLRGLLWAAVRDRSGACLALLFTSVLFALMHVPLYGWRAIPLDLGVGLGLGALRIWSGGVTAPAVAHLVADVAGGLL